MCSCLCLYMLHTIPGQAGLPLTGLKPEETLPSLPQTHFLDFTLPRSPPLCANEMCQSQGTLLAARSTAGAETGEGQAFADQPGWKSGMPSSPSPPPPLPLLLPLFLLSLMAHTKLTGRSVTAPSSDHEKATTNLPRG